MTNKEYPIPDELALLHDKARAAKVIRNLAVKTPFGYKKAMRAATEGITFLREFVNQVIKLYPELNDKKMSYSPNDQIITIENDKVNV